MSTRQHPLAAMLFHMLNNLFQENSWVLLESVSVFWAVSPYESLHEEGLIWHPDTKKFKFWGDIDAKIEWTTLQDAAEYSIQLVASHKAAEGGEYYFYSGKHSLKELGSVYESIAGETVDYERRGSLNELRVLLEQKRREFGIKEWPEYIALVYSLFMMSGIGASKRDDGISFPEVQKTPLEQFMLRVVEGRKEL